MNKVFWMLSWSWRLKMKVAYVSCAELPEPDIDQIPFVDALTTAGHQVQVLAWDDPSADWAAHDVAVVRATWNYFDDLQAFRDWVDRVDSLTTLLNPASTLHWNMHKGYLRDLEKAGVPIVPTEFFEIGQDVKIADVCRSREWTKIVIKPTVSAGSFGTRVFDLDEAGHNEAQSFFDRMIREREMMIQVFMDSVNTVGETALVVIDDAVSHAIEKRPRFDDQDESVLLREVITDEMREVADRVLKAAGHDVLYARVDVMPDHDGRLILSELELLEPSLFFPYWPEAMDAFIQGLVKRCASAHS
ncbi:MAG: RimK family alpha-L-glutamate ligase [Phycisphaerales bacterium]